MNFIESVILGVLQGLTEFLPVSSSGHLVLAQAMMGIKDPMVFYDVILHFGTLVAILVVYRKDIAAIIGESITMARNGSADGLPNAKMLVMIAAASVPVALVGLFFEDAVEALFASPFIVGLMLIVTGAILFATRKNSGGGKMPHEISMKAALLIGLAQAFALVPGISRSGSTIAAGLLLGLERESAARFSFILSIPAVSGAIILKSLSASVSADAAGMYIAGFAVSLAVGVGALYWLINLVKRGKLSSFSYYVWAVGLAAILSNLL
ncbi:MAG: undecaprenyl-diphosphate phosphatase [Nitrospinota bacterium]